MKIKILFTLLLLSPLLFGGCHKDKNNKPAKPKCKIITETGGLNDYSCTYNSDGKVQTIVFGQLTTTYTYSGNTAIATTKNNSGVFYRKATITFNESGMTTNEKVEQNVAGTDWFNIAYVYNGTKLIKETMSYPPAEGIPPQTYTYTWSGGNPVSMTEPYSGGVMTYTYEYYTDKPSQQGGYLRFMDLTGGIKTMLPKNLVKSISGNGYIDNYSYHFKSDGTISDFTDISSNGSSLTYSFQYQCK